MRHTRLGAGNLHQPINQQLNKTVPTHLNTLNLTEYQTRSGSSLRFDREQGSRFAKFVAGDFNPLHDVEARRFCVPGDLLFVSLLSQYGVAAETSVEFDGMVDEKDEFEMPESIGERFELSGADGKNFLTLLMSGQRVPAGAFVDALSMRYVQFSGKTFPDILVPLMKQNAVMLNPARPLVIYKNMSISLNDQCFDTTTENVLAASDSGFDDLQLELDDDQTRLELQGKKGEAILNFTIQLKGVEIGTGRKKMILGGLRTYEQAAIDDVVQQYRERKMGNEIGEFAVEESVLC